MTSGPIDVRVRIYEEIAGFIPGGFYFFDSKPGGTTRWRRAVDFRHDGLPPIEPPGVVKVVSDRTAFLYIGWVYAVTTDSGRTWHRWSAADDLAGWSCCNYGVIDSISIGPDGRGTMYLDLIEAAPGTVPELKTDDYGLRWHRVPDGASSWLR
jgi:hypothetical protein